jgi:hypothetical protein
VLEYNPRHYLSPYKRVWAAVLRRALLDYALYYGRSGSSKEELGSEAYEWFFSHSEDEHLDTCSFESVCTTLGFTSRDIRARISCIDPERVNSLLRNLELSDNGGAVQ